MIQEKIINLADDKNFNPDSLKLVEEADRHVIIGKGDFIVRLFDVDAEIEGISRDILAETARLKIIEAINSYRYERSNGLLIKTHNSCFDCYISIYFITFFTAVCIKAFRQITGSKIKS